eukprot:jgi/Mesvir1/21887/Mv01956-RA.1
MGCLWIAGCAFASADVLQSSMLEWQSILHFPVNKTTYSDMVTSADLSQRSLVTSVLEDGARLGMTVLRTWAFNVCCVCQLTSALPSLPLFLNADGAQNWNALQKWPGTYAEYVFVGLDFVLAEAQRLNLRVLLSLVNWWEDYGGVPQYVQWANSSGAGLTNMDDFYTDGVCKGYFKEHVRTVLNRKNVFTGIIYREDRNIFGWELINEPRSYSVPNGTTIQAWAAEMAAFVKLVDPNHLVTVGSEGHYGPLTPDRCLNANPGCVPLSPHTPFVCSHPCTCPLGIANCNSVPEPHTSRLGGSPLSQELEFLSRWNAAHIEDAQNILRMPVVGAEFGHRATGPSDTLDERVRVFDGIYRATQESAASGGPAAGALFWLLNAQGTADWNGYGVTAGQVTNTDITKQSKIMAGIQGPPDNLIINPSMETGTAQPWFAFGLSANVGRSTLARTGLRGLLVSNRTVATWEGPAQETVTGGVQYMQVANATVTSDDWTRLNGEWVAPDGQLKQVVIYAEGPPVGVAMILDDAEMFMKTSYATNCTHLIYMFFFNLVSLDDTASWDETAACAALRAVSDHAARDVSILFVAPVGVCSSFQGTVATGAVGVPVVSRFPDDSGYAVPVSGSHKHTVWVKALPSLGDPASALLSFWREDTPGNWGRQLSLALASGQDTMQISRQASSGRYRWQLLAQSGSLDYQLHIEVPPSPPAGCGDIGDCFLYQQWVSASLSTAAVKQFDYSTLAGNHEHEAWLTLPASRDLVNVSLSFWRYDAAWSEAQTMFAVPGDSIALRSQQTTASAYRWKVEAIVGASNFNLFYESPRQPPLGCGDAGYQCLLYQGYVSVLSDAPRLLNLPTPPGCYSSSTAGMQAAWLQTPASAASATLYLSLWRREPGGTTWERRTITTAYAGDQKYLTSAESPASFFWRVYAVDSQLKFSLYIEIPAASDISGCQP